MTRRNKRKTPSCRNTGCEVSVRDTKMLLARISHLGESMRVVRNSFGCKDLDPGKRCLDNVIEERPKD